MYQIFYDFISEYLWVVDVPTAYTDYGIEAMAHLSLWLFYVCLVLFIIGVFRFFSGFAR